MNGLGAQVSQVDDDRSRASTGFSVRRFQTPSGEGAQLAESADFSLATGADFWMAVDSCAAAISAVAGCFSTKAALRAVELTRRSEAERRLARDVLELGELVELLAIVSTEDGQALRMACNRLKAKVAALGPDRFPAAAAVGDLAIGRRDEALIEVHEAIAEARKALLAAREAG